MTLTIRQVIEERAKRAPTSAVLHAPGRPVLDSLGLDDLVSSTVERFHQLGLRRGDRVALSLPNGPESATAFLCAAAGATCAPLNPTYRKSEFDFYLSDLGAKLLIVSDGEVAANSPAVEAARELGVAVIELSIPERSPAGVFELAGTAIELTSDVSDHELPTMGDTALVLHTSGTTSRPKIVPLSQQNLAESAANILKTLRLDPSDRCLNVMPLFHIHGLLGVLLSSLHAGASVIATPGFSAPQFFDWLRELEPTWYSAVPTIHQVVLVRAGHESDAVSGSGLRLIRSSSSALAPNVLADLERAFGVPVIEAYGMTEAAHQMACNPLPPAARKPGSVGPAAGPEICVLDDDWQPLAAGEVGEVSIRGANVTAGYEANPEANLAAFRDSWFRTGDQGYMDAEGYLFLTGRLKEIINRAGEKISPREIDEVLLEHPAVAQAVTFAMPDVSLGEDVAAAVVLCEGQTASKRELQAFAAERLADFKLPREIVFLDEIPKGPTGKLQRIGLAEKLGVGQSRVEATVESRPAETATEKLLVELFEELLKVASVDAGSDFFALGGDSLLALRLSQRVAKSTGVTIPVYELFEQPNVARLAAFIDGAEQNFTARDPLPIAGEEARELSFAQAGLWVQERLAGGSPINNRFGALQLTGTLDVPVLERALGMVLERHDVLRARYPVQNRRPTQEFLAAEPPTLEVHDLTQLDPDAKRVAVANRAHDLASKTLDLQTGPVCRFELLALADREHILSSSIHHIAFDGWSMSVFANDLAECYGLVLDGKEECRQDSKTRFSDHALWQRRRVESEVLTGQVDYWREQLEGERAELELAESKSRPETTTAATCEAARCDVVLPEATHSALLELGRKQGTTLFMTLLAAFDLLLLHWSGSEDIVIGTVVAGRDHPQTENLIGLFANSLVLRSDLSGDPTFRELLGRVRRVALGAYANSEVPFEVVVRELKPPMVMGRNPYFDIVFQMRNLPKVSASAGELRFQSMSLEPGFARFELLVEVFEEAGLVHTRFEYRTHRFAGELMSKWTDRWLSILESIAANPDLRLSQFSFDANPL